MELEFRVQKPQVLLFLSIIANIEGGGLGGVNRLQDIENVPFLLNFVSSRQYRAISSNSLVMLKVNMQNLEQGDNRWESQQSQRISSHSSSCKTEGGRVGVIAMCEMRMKEMLTTRLPLFEKRRKTPC